MVLAKEELKDYLVKLFPHFLADFSHSGWVETRPNLLSKESVEADSE